MKTMILCTAALMAAASFAAAQPSGQTEQTGTSDAGMSSDMGANAGGSMGDAKLAATIKAINDTEVTAGKTAVKRAHSKSVKQFARMMVRDHGRNNSELASVSKRIGLQPMPDQEVTAMKDQSKQDMQALESETGADFDKAYIDQMVKGHEDALKKLDDAISSNAGRNEQLDGYIKKTRQAVSRHLDEAKKIQSELAGGGRTPENGGTDTKGEYR